MIDIGRRRVGDGAPCFIMAEVGLAHEGSVGMAHAFIDAVALRGVDAVKFQMHIAAEESLPDEPWRVKPLWPQDASRYDYWDRTAFSHEQWWGLMKHANQRGIEFICSPFSVEAVRVLEAMVPAWKIPSGEITNKPLLEAIAKTGKPVILSTGMCTPEELHSAEGFFDYDRRLVLQCTSLYPCYPDKLNLSAIRIAGLDGLSDHSGTIYAGLVAAAYGASVIEVHVTFSKESYGFDAASSLDMTQLKQLVEGARFIEEALKRPDKDAMAKELEPMRELFLRKHDRKAAADGR